MRTLVVYSSRTGNTKKVADAIYGIMPEGSKIAPVKDDPNFEDYDFVVLGFWVDKGLPDKKAQEYMRKIKGKKVGLFATLGADPDSEHANDCMKHASEMVRSDNDLIGHFISQGKVDPKLIKMFGKLPPDHPHALTPKQVSRHERASTHPDQDDLRNAGAAFKEMLAKM
ncbi:MAG: flavodoxin family protein, partial [Methanosarcinales archaeon]|nr:flavodoxin family protein [Methanosarcinales archaeon]